MEQKQHAKLLTFDVPTSVGHSAKVLIDCGSTTNFISRRYVNKHNLPTRPAPRAQVMKLADGSEHFTTRVVESFHMYFSDRDGQL